MEISFNPVNDAVNPEAAAWAYLQVIEGEPAAVRRALKAA